MENSNLRIDRKDSQHWTLSKDGEFSVRSCLSLSEEEAICADTWKRLWSLKVPSNVLFFLWIACRDWLPTIDNLQKRGMYLPNVFPLCYRDAELVDHILIHCL